MKHDAKVNEALKAAGFIVLRFKEHEINRSVEDCISLIIAKLNKSVVYESS